MSDKVTQEDLDALESAIAGLKKKRAEMRLLLCPPWLDEELREALITEVAQGIECNSFGDGQNLEYATGGCELMGASEMTDDELVDEYGCIHGADEPESLWEQIRDCQSRRALVSALQMSDGKEEVI